MKKVVVSGGFDPVHIGHLRLFKKARGLGDHLTVILNSDNFLIEKKGFCFMPFEERKEILLGFASVNSVVECIDQDHTVRKTIEMLADENAIDIFANGGDRKNIEDIPEYQICKKNNIEMIFDIGGEKLQSSSSLIDPFINYIEKRPWGKFENLMSSQNFLVKKISIQPRQKLSLQYHNHRAEYWVVVNGSGLITIDNEEIKCSSGSTFQIKKNQLHRIENNNDEDLVLIEVQIGENLSEEDIVRVDDLYGRN